MGQTNRLRKAIGIIHLWLGLVSGLVVVILGITGAIYIFADDLKPLIYKERYYVAPQNKPKLPLSQIIAIAKKNLGKKHRIGRAEISTRPDRPYIFRALKINNEALTYHNSYLYYYRIYINPYNGEVLFLENTKYEFFQVVLAIHMTLLLGNTLGHAVVGYSVIIFVLLLLSGIMLWWPKKWNKKNRENSFSIKWKAKFKRLNYDLHNVFGFYTFLLLLVISLTGLVFSFKWFDNTVQFVARGGKTLPKETPMLSDTTLLFNKNTIDEIFAQAQSKSPGTAKYLISLPAKPNGTINVSAYQSDKKYYQRNQGTYDQFDGKLLQENTFTELNNGAKIKALNYDLHTGSALGYFGKALALFASLTASSLPITGFLIWQGKRKKKPKRP